MFHSVSLVAWMCIAQSGDGVEERFIRLLDSAVPKTGVVEAIYVRPDGGGEIRIGFDFGSGAWFKATGSHTFGQDPSGAIYSGDAGLGRTTIVRGDGVVEAVAVQSFVPVVALWIAQHRPQLVKQVIDADGGFVARMIIGFGGPAPDEITVTVDRSGKVTRFQMAVLNEAKSAPLEYSSAHPLLVSRVTGTDVQLKAVVADRTIDQFARARVEGVSAQLKLNHAKLQATQTQAAREQSSPDIPQRGSIAPGAEWRLPLVVTGLLLVGVGIFAYVRKRAL